MKSKQELIRVTPRSPDFELCECSDPRYMHIDSSDECFTVGCADRRAAGGWISKCHRFKPKKETPTFRDPETVFEEAIEQGRLSDTPGTDNYAGRFMYMGTWSDVDAFKHIDTREYLPAANSGEK